jgi:sugar lactone lactonase YvrE
MEEVSSIAMGAPGFMATCQESRNTYNDQAPPNDFMGPALWSTDRAVFGESNPEAIEYLSNLYGFYTDLGSHLDMLHQTPLCMGIAWEDDNVFWTFDGLTGSISRQDFKEDHGPGWDDHSDGEILRYVEGDVLREPDVPSHLVYDDASGLLYVADTGNGRIAVLDTTTGTPGADLPRIEPYPVHRRMDGAEIRTLVDGADGHLVRPSGLALHDDHLFVSDNATGRISAYSLDGELLDWIDAGAQTEGLMGIEFGPDGGLYWIDAVAARVTRFRARPAPE